MQPIVFLARTFKAPLHEPCLTRWASLSPVSEGCQLLASPPLCAGVQLAAFLALCPDCQGCYWPLSLCCPKAGLGPHSPLGSRDNPRRGKSAPDLSEHGAGAFLIATEVTQAGTRHGHAASAQTWQTRGTATCPRVFSLLNTTGEGTRVGCCTGAAELTWLLQTHSWFATEPAETRPGPRAGTAAAPSSQPRSPRHSAKLYNCKQSVTALFAIILRLKEQDELNELIKWLPVKAGPRCIASQVRQGSCICRARGAPAMATRR